jgi:hypothetical protein
VSPGRHSRHHILFALAPASERTNGSLAAPDWAPRNASERTKWVSVWSATIVRSFALADAAAWAVGEIMPLLVGPYHAAMYPAADFSGLDFLAGFSALWGNLQSRKEQEAQ